MAIRITKSNEISRVPILDPTLDPGIDNIYKGSTKINKGADNGLKIGNIPIERVYNGGSVLYQRDTPGLVHNYDTVVMEYEADYHVEVRNAYLSGKAWTARQVYTINQNGGVSDGRTTIDTYYSNSDWLTLKNRASNTPVFLNIDFIKNNLPIGTRIGQEQHALDWFSNIAQRETVFGVILNGDPFQETTGAFQGTFTRKANDGTHGVTEGNVHKILYDCKDVYQLYEFTQWMNIPGGDTRRLNIWGGFLSNFAGKTTLIPAHMESVDVMHNEFGTGLKPIEGHIAIITSFGEIKTKIRWQQTFTMDRGATPSLPYPTN